METVSASVITSIQKDSLADDSLVRLARTGDYAAFEVLFERHRTMVYRFVYQMVPRRDDAEDIVQESFVKAYQNLDRYRDQAKFTTWLLRISANLSTDFCRTCSRRQNLEQQQAKYGLDWMTIGYPEDPLENMDQDRMRSALRRAISALPAHHRLAFVLRDIEFKEYSEISEILGCSLGGAKLRVLRARRVLRDRLGPILGDSKDA